MLMSGSCKDAFEAETAHDVGTGGRGRREGEGEGEEERVEAVTVAKVTMRGGEDERKKERQDREGDEEERDSRQQESCAVPARSVCTAVWVVQLAAVPLSGAVW
eukprot:2141952-Rhodomonas_salina.3